MFKDLEQQQAVLIGNSYIVQLGSPYDRSEYRVNGVLMNSGKVCLESLDDIYKVIPATKQLNHYDLNGEMFALGEFNRKNPSTFYDDDYGEMVFGSLEQEYEFKKEWERVKDATPIYDETEEQLEKVGIDVVGSAVDTGSEFIQTPYQFGKAFFDKTNSGIFSVNIHSVACNEVTRLKGQYPDIKFEIPTHSGLTYLQVDGKYIYGGKSLESYVTGNNSTRVVQTLKQAQDLEDGIRQKVRQKSMVQIKGSNELGLNTIKSYHDFLNATLSKVVSLEIKKKAYTSKRLLSESIQSKITELEKSLLNN